MLEFRREEAITPEMREEVRRAGWELAGPDAWPVLMTMNTVGCGVQDDQVMRFAAAIGALGRAATQLAALFATPYSRSVDIVIRDDATGVLVRRHPA